MGKTDKDITEAKLTVLESYFGLYREDGVFYTGEAAGIRDDEIMLGGKSTVDFVIGGSLGLCAEVKRRSDLNLSFSKFTFPHQLMRPILCEQIYRAFKINANEEYHK